MYKRLFIFVFILNFIVCTRPGALAQIAPEHWLKLNGNVGIGVANPASRLQVAGGDIYLQDIGSGIIMRSPNGQCWRVTLDDNGNFLRKAIGCPGTTGPFSLSLTPTQDTYSDSYNYTSLTGNSYAVAVGSWTTDGMPMKLRAFLQFDVSGIPATARIDSAFVVLSYYYNWFANPPYTGNNEVFIQRITANWSEASLTWQNMPGTTMVGQLSVPSTVITSTVYQRLNLKSLVSDWVANPATNYGFMMRLQDESNAPPYRVLLFASNNNPTPALRPQLVAYYSL